MLQSTLSSCLWKQKLQWVSVVGWNINTWLWWVKLDRSYEIAWFYQHVGCVGTSSRLKINPSSYGFKSQTVWPFRNKRMNYEAISEQPFLVCRNPIPLPCSIRPTHQIILLPLEVECRLFLEFDIFHKISIPSALWHVPLWINGHYFMVLGIKV